MSVNNNNNCSWKVCVGIALLAAAAGAVAARHCSARNQGNVTADATERSSKKKEEKEDEDRRRLRRRINGLVTAVPVSDALNAFLGNPAGTLVTRVEAAKAIFKYCKDNLETGSTNGHRVLDAKMSALWPGLEEIHLFYPQKYLKDHFLRRGEKTAGEESLEVPC